MSNRRFTPRQLRFLELYFSGHKMKNAARAAGYRGASDQTLCNTGRKILAKLGKNPTAIFDLSGERGIKIALLLRNMAFGAKSVHKQLKGLDILARCYFP